MNLMKLLLCFSCFLITVVSCKRNTVKKDPEKLSHDTLEKSLQALKDWSFSECYTQSEYNTYKRLGIDIQDSCFIKSHAADLTGYYYVNSSDIDLHWVFEDSNRIKLVSKWVNKAEYTPRPINPPDFPDGSLNMVRALDFYNSDDLKKYIDSVRKVIVTTAPTANSRHD